FEQRLGVLLFARTSRGTQLTPRGEFLLPWARAILAAADHVRGLMRASSPLSGVIRIALCDDVPSRHLLPLLAQFQQAHPQIAISHVERLCNQQAEEIGAELIDIGFGLFPADVVKVSVEPLWTQPACAVLPLDHILANDTELDASSFVGQRL